MENNCKKNIGGVETHEENPVPFINDEARLQHEHDENQQDNRQYGNGFENSFCFKAMVGLEASSKACVQYPWESQTNHDVECVRAKSIGDRLVSKAVLGRNF